LIATIIILSILLCTSVFVNINLLRKFETLEDDNEYMIDWIEKLSTQVNDVIRRVREIDRKGIFEKDDEVGVVYDELKKLIETLEKLVVKVNE